jgi:glutathionyl-hydroquinone reductase
VQHLGGAKNIAEGALENKAELLNVYEAKESPQHRGEFGVEILWDQTPETQVWMPDLTLHHFGVNLDLRR